MIYIVFDNSSKNGYVSGWDHPMIAYISDNENKCKEFMQNKKADYIRCNPDGKLEVDEEKAFGLDCGKWFYEMYIDEYPYETDILNNY